MAKITIIGGGSYLWAFGFVKQFAMSKALAGSEIVLMDIAPEPLKKVFDAASVMNARNGSSLRLSCTDSLNDALRDADYVLITISTGGLDAMTPDLEIPERYGIRHTVGDTVGPGGFSRLARNAPVFYDFGERMSRLCPDAWLLNCSNPLTPLTRIPHKYFGTKVIGMCPSVEETAAALVKLAGLEASKEAVSFTVTGIDHGSYFTRLKCGETDILQWLKENGFCCSEEKAGNQLEIEDGAVGNTSMQAVFAIWREIGCLPSITDRHAVENFSWFILRQSDEDIPFEIVRTDIARRRDRYEMLAKRLDSYIQSDCDENQNLGHGDDPIVDVIESLEGLREFRYTCNMPNLGQIPELPRNAVVETRCRFDAQGPHPDFSPMPSAVQAIVLPTVVRQEALLDAVLKGDFDDFMGLVISDPLFSGMDVTTARKLMRELLNANKRWIKNPRLLSF